MRFLQSPAYLFTPVRVQLLLIKLFYTRYVIILHKTLVFTPVRVYNQDVKENKNSIGKFLKEKRKEAGLTQEDFAIRSGLGLRFIRELEQGKETVRLDKVNQALSMFGYSAQAVKIKTTNSEEASDE